MKIYTIYKATNNINNKVYIGFTQNFKKRIASHKIGSRNYSNKERKSSFYEAILKYGWNNFSWEIIYQSKELFHTKNEMEPFFIIEYNSYCGFDKSNGYNLTLGGEGSTGRICEEKTKQKLKELMSEKYNTPEIKERQRRFAIDWWNCLSESEKISHAEKSRHEIPWNKGKSGEFRHSKETKEKMSKSQMGHSSYERTEEILNKFRLSRKGKGTGKNNSMAKEENRKKVSESKIGKKLYINPITLERKYYFPGNDPEGFVIIKRI